MFKQNPDADLSLEQPNSRQSYEITRDQLPLHCPLPGTSLWNSHPRVFIPVEDTGEAHCPYCGAWFSLKAD